MAAGRWAVNGEPIIIADDDGLNDGQHRLHAVVAAGITIDAIVVRGVAADTFDTLGAARVRSAGDVIALCGGQHVNVAAAAARMALNFSLGRQLRFGATRKEITDYWAAHPYVQTAAGIAHNHRGHLSASALAAVIFLANERGFFDEQIADFLDGVQTGAGLPKGDPRLTLREWATNERLRGRGAVAASTAFSAIARAWTAFARGEQLKLIKPTSYPTQENTTIVGHTVGTITPRKRAA